MFQTRLIFEENDKEEYFNFFSQTNIDIFYRFANKAAGIVFQCQCEKGEKKKKWLRDLRNLNLVEAQRDLKAWSWFTLTLRMMVDWLPIHKAIKTWKNSEES